MPVGAARSPPWVSNRETNAVVNEGFAAADVLDHGRWKRVPSFWLAPLPQTCDLFPTESQRGQARRGKTGLFGPPCQAHPQMPWKLRGRCHTRISSSGPQAISKSRGQAVSD